MTIGFMLQVMLGALMRLPASAAAAVDALASLRRSSLRLCWLGGVALAAGSGLVSPITCSCRRFARVIHHTYFLLTAGRALFGVPSSRSERDPWPQAGFRGAGRRAGARLFIGEGHYGAGLVFAADGLGRFARRWGFGAWAGALLAAVAAYVVVPMFQLTPGYPARFGWRFPVLVLGEAVLWTLASVLDLHLVAQIAQLLLALTIAQLCRADLASPGLAAAGAGRALSLLALWFAGSFLAAAMMSTAALRPEIADGSWTQVFGILTLGGLSLSSSACFTRWCRFWAGCICKTVGQAKVPHRR